MNEEQEEEKALAQEETVLIPDELWEELTDNTQSPNPYPPEDKIRAVVAHVNHGSINRAAKAVNIPRKTVEYWSKSTWWPKVKHQVYRLCDDQMVATQTRLAQKALEEAEDRILNGEYVYDKDGDLVLDDDGKPKRKKLPIKDVMVYGHAIPLDKRALLKGEGPKRKDSGTEFLKELRGLLYDVGAKNITPQSVLIDHDEG